MKLRLYGFIQFIIIIIIITLSKSSQKQTKIWIAKQCGYDIQSANSMVGKESCSKIALKSCSSTEMCWYWPPSTPQC